MNYCQSFCRTIQRLCNSAGEAAKQPYTIDFTLDTDGMSCNLFYEQTVANAATVDWGDGTTTTTSGTIAARQNVTHTYSTAGNYRITINILTGINDFLPDRPNYAGARFLIFSGGTVTYSAIVIPDGVTTIKNYVFRIMQSAPIDYTLPDSIQTIGYETFYEAGFAKTTLPDSLVSIDYGGFYHNTITAITIPSGVTSIGEHAFRYCSRLASVTFLGQTPPTFGAYSFGNIASGAIVYIPSGTLSAYTAAFGSSGLANKTIVEQ